jgi:hypothetical protein
MKKLFLILLLFSLNAIGAEKHWLTEKCRININQIGDTTYVMLQHPTKKTSYQFGIKKDNTVDNGIEHSTITGNFELFGNIFEFRRNDLDQILKTFNEIKAEQARLHKLSELGEVGGLRKTKAFDAEEIKKFGLKNKYYYTFEYGLKKDEATKKLASFIDIRRDQLIFIPSLRATKGRIYNMTLKNTDEINQFINDLSYIQKYKEDINSKCIKIKKLYE